MKSNVNHNHYEAAKWKAIDEIYATMRKYYRLLDRFEATGDTKYTFKAMYYLDAAQRIARDWGMKLERIHSRENFYIGY